MCSELTIEKPIDVLPISLLLPFFLWTLNKSLLTVIRSFLRYRFGNFFVNWRQISHLNLLFLLSTLNWVLDAPLELKCTKYQ